MGEKYDGETCAGCVWWCPKAFRCTNEEVSATEIGWSVGATPCPCFILSLECRKVRALERLAGCVDDFGKGGAFNVFDQAKDS